LRPDELMTETLQDLCVCGHPRGEHAKRGGVHAGDCLHHDTEGRYCHCSTFRARKRTPKEPEPPQTLFEMTDPATDESEDEE
jgi:hypothetical protein